MTFEVETGSLSSTIRSMEAELSNMAVVGKKLYAALEALDSMWIGAAHDAFAAQYLADQQMLSDMQKTIESIIKGMETARKKYDECEKSVATEIKKIAI